MSRQLQIASKLEMRAVIRFMCAKRCYCTEIYGQLHEAYGENTMSRQSIAKWCNMFENGPTDIDNAKREGRPSTATNSEIAARVNECILANRRIMIDEISNEVDISHGSVHKIISDHLKFRKVCTRWVPRLLTEEQSVLKVYLHFCNVTKRKDMGFWTKL
ncbi:protein GVQW3-like [Stegodyphus dumicola]|uniref:protein GVQW3-like n=1 Tax=Stegodyphus dumicola TaxID=202533 RepID=UPI0015B28EDD|nr:protein GVQW3-like [Stegodyphus dumicola]